MVDDITTKRLYTTLDSLFDTELAYLDLLDGRLAREYLTNEYNIENSYLYLSYNSFMSLFKDRDKRLLKLSKGTSVIDVLRNIINDMDIKRKVGSSSNFRISLIINTYPYNLEPVEIQTLKDFYRKYFLFVDDIEFIYKEEMSKAFISKLSIIIDRYGLDWFMNMKIKYIGFRCPHVRLIIPDRYYYSNYIKNLGVESNKMIEYLQTTLMSDVRLDVIEKETFMMKLSVDETDI